MHDEAEKHRLSGVQQMHQQILKEHTVPKEVIERLWYKVKNMMGVELEWEWLAKAKDGEYVERAEVLRLIEKYLPKLKP